MKYKITDNITRASAALLKEIIQQHGGYSEVARATKTTRQSINSYINYGHTPLANVYAFSKALGVSVWELSYVKLLEVFGEESIPFDKVVKKSKLPKGTKDYILSLYK